jgi:hypothetical protein
MSFKEKSAWVMFVALICGAFFYADALADYLIEDDDINLIGIVVLYVVIIVVVSIIGHIIAALTFVKEAETPADERDKIISTRANSMSSYILGFGAVSGIIFYLLLGDGDMLFHFVLASLTLSSIAEYGLQIYFYRTGV